MRVCRFAMDDIVLNGLFYEDYIVPIHQAADAYCAEVDIELFLPSAETLLDLLPPDGPSCATMRDLAGWVDELDVVSRDELAVPIEEVTLLVPIAQPNKVLLLAGNYAAHVAERGGVAAEREETFPYVFMKPPSTTLTHPGAPIVIPRVSPDHVDWECELGVVIGRRCRDVPESDALNYVAGYTIVNDISDRRFTPNAQRKPRERDRFFDWLHGKWHDSFCPIGPCLLSAADVPDPQDLELELTVNDEVKQRASTAQMVFPVAAIISFISQFVTLEPGDVISTGTPAGVGSSTGTYLKPGDLVRATISGIGTLENPVVMEE
ncbi:MAG: fumarylacetoacetate hydrolase family protein [Isosphaeraceae bacterium]|nr:fumarylacetoacetate hydrolase family protein [Isosphaeraceae bacterium]